MRPELLSRVTDVIIFKYLSKKDIRLIIAHYLEILNQRLASKIKLNVKLTSGVINHLINQYQPEKGIRPLLSLMQNKIEDAIKNGNISILQP